MQRGDDREEIHLPQRGESAGDEEQRIARQERRDHQPGLAEHDDEEQPVHPHAVLLHELAQMHVEVNHEIPQRRREAPSADCIICAPLAPAPLQNVFVRRPDQSERRARAGGARACRDANRDRRASGSGAHRQGCGRLSRLRGGADRQLPRVSRRGERHGGARHVFGRLPRRPRQAGARCWASRSPRPTPNSCAGTPASRSAGSRRWDTRFRRCSWRKLWRRRVSCGRPRAIRTPCSA